MIPLRSFIFACAAFVGVQGTHTAASGATYTHKVVLSENEYDVFWKYDSQNITFEVEVATTGWVGFGLSPNGGMAGADIVIGGVNADGSKYFTDRHATSNGLPSIDNEQNYELLHSSQSSTKTTLRFTRKLETCDVNDMLVNGDTFRVIWAYGDSDTISYHNSRRGTKSVLLLASTTPKPTMPSDTISWDFVVDSVTVPGKDTVYWCKGFNVPSLPQKHHVLKYEPIITAGNEALVHHVIIYACFGDVNTTGAHLLDAENCGLMPNNLQPSCTSNLFAWAVGGETFYYPPDVGFPFGDAEQPTFLLLEIHYDNPSLATNLVDSSGLRLTLSPTLRQYDAGLLTMGQTVHPNQAVPPGQQSFTSYGLCNSDCTSEALSSQPNGVKIFAGALHSHLLGRKMRLRHFRNGVEQEPLFVDNNYDFNYQEMVVRRSEKVFLPGDEMQLECELNSSGKNKFTYGGLATTDEMCMAFLLYYPRTGFTTCYNFPYNFGHFLTAKGIPFEYNAQREANVVTSGQYSGMDERTVLVNMNWTADNAKTLETSMKDNEYLMICMKGATSLSTMNKPYGTYKGGINITQTYAAPPSSCDATTTGGTVGATNDPNYGLSLHAVDVAALLLMMLFHLLCC